MPILGIIASGISGNLGVSVESIAIAGGGGGGGGGGGAGGLLYTANTFVPFGVSQTVTVGAGGPGSFGPHQMGRDSVFGALTATGGGKSDGTSGAESFNGGSGGGSSTAPGVAGGTGISGQGFNGGAGQPSGPTPGFGGGGGAGGVGSNGASSGTPCGPGGTGSNTYSTWLSAISSSMAGGWQTATSGGRIAGGGGGGAGSGTVGFNPNAGSGGSGGGGAGAVYAAGGFAVTNTGGGGGGSYGTGGGNGASGLVIIRYLSSLANASSTTGSPTLVTSGGYKYYVWIGSGSITF